MNHSIRWRQQAMRLGLRARLAMTRWPSVSRTRRTRVFAEYSRHLLQQLAAPERSLSIRSTHRFTHPLTGKQVVRLELASPEGGSVQPGDLLHVCWENDPGRVGELGALLGDPDIPAVALWEAGSVYRPARQVTCSYREVLTSVLDLGVPSDDLIAQAGLKPTSPPAANWTQVLGALPYALRWSYLLRYQTRMRPRLYSLSRVSGAWELLVSVHPVPGGIGGRASRYLSRLKPGQSIRARKLSHPHRLPPAWGHSGPGLVVATGTAIAVPLAAWRNHGLPEGTTLVWGVSDADWAHAVAPDLCASSRVGRPTIEWAFSRPGGTGQRVRVGDSLERRKELLERVIRERGWIYISGQHGMADSVSAQLEQQGCDLGQPPGWLRAWSDQMRCIISASH